MPPSTEHRGGREASQLPYSVGTGKFPAVQGKELTNSFLLPNQEFKSNQTTTPDPWCSEPLLTDLQDCVTEPSLFFLANDHDDQGG